MTSPHSAKIIGVPGKHPQVMLFNFDGNEELVDIYTKFNLIDNDSRKRVVVISFHKRNKPIDYLFRCSIRKFERRSPYEQ